MLKIAAVVSLMLIGSTLWAAGLSCDSCGHECASACGTRHFRSCCFNYLRRKRVLPSSEISGKMWPPKFKPIVGKPEDHPKPSKKIPIFAIEDVPEPWMSNLVSSDFDPYPLEDNYENRMPIPFEI